MLTARPSVVNAFLFAVCLLAVSSQLSDGPCSYDLFWKVKNLANEAPNQKCLDCRLYTPTIEDYQNCPNATLRCFAGEVKVLADEWEVNDKKRPKHLDKKLERLASHFNMTESGCVQCELLPEKDVENFLKDLLNTLKIMNSQYCKKPTSPPQRDS